MNRSLQACNKNDQALRCWCFNTFFVEKLTKGYMEYDYKKVRRWTKKNKVKRLIGVNNIFECDLWLIPVHVSHFHWTCGVINVKEQTIEYYDSLSGGRHMD